jgi:hypothetical protein
MFANEHYDGYFADLNGDGLTDIVSMIGNPPTPVASILIWFARDNVSNSMDAWTVPFSFGLPGFEYFLIYPQDVNGDKRPGTPDQSNHVKQSSPNYWLFRSCGKWPQSFVRSW